MHDEKGMSAGSSSRAQVLEAGWREQRREAWTLARERNHEQRTNATTRQFTTHDAGRHARAGDGPRTALGTVAPSCCLGSSGSVSHRTTRRASQSAYSVANSSDPRAGTSSSAGIQCSACRHHPGAKRLCSASIAPISWAPPHFCPRGGRWSVHTMSACKQVNPFNATRGRLEFCSCSPSCFASPRSDSL